MMSIGFSLCHLRFGVLAVLIAMATACFCGLPALISVLMFALMAARLLPFFRGTADPFWRHSFDR